MYSRIDKEEKMKPFERLKADLHTHTIASGHAFSTVNEIAAEACRKGLDLVGITDHGPALPGAPHRFFFACMAFIPEVLHGVRILRGIEANIVGKCGVDLPDALLERLDFVLAGFHDQCGYAGEGLKDNTRALIGIMKNPLIRGIVHPGNPRYPIDHVAVLKAAAETKTAIEINNASLIGSRQGSDENCLEIARLCARFEVPVMINSDAHIAQSVGDTESALKLARDAGVRWEQIVNRTLESTLRFLGLDH